MEKRKTVLITDAGSAVAEAIAKRLESDGFTVIRNFPRPFSTEDGGFCEKARFSFNTCSELQMRDLLQLITEKFGNIHYLIHTDNVIHRCSIQNITEEEFKKCMDENAKSAFFTTKVFGEHIAGHGKGAILYLSTIHDEKPTGCAFAYSAAKGAVKMLCREMALFYGRKGVRVNLIEMDAIEAEEELFDSRISPFHYDADTKIPLHRMAAPEDFTGAAAFLLSDDAAFINGVEIRVDGGHLLYYRDR